MLDGNEQRIRMVYSLLFSLPGTPVLFYGEEIGMGENLAIDGRLSVRSPMQWTDERNGGFSQAAPSRLGRPVVEGRFGPMAVNVAAQRRDPDSLLNWMERTIRRRRETPELGWGAWEVLETDEPAVLALMCEWQERVVVTLHNLGEEPCVVRVKLGRDLPEGSLLHDLLEVGSPSVQEFAGDVVETKLEGFGYRWFRLQQPGQPTAP
jgi:glycosidase